MHTGPILYLAFRVVSLSPVSTPGRAGGHSERASGRVSDQSVSHLGRLFGSFFDGSAHLIQGSVYSPFGLADMLMKLVMGILPNRVVV